MTTEEPTYSNRPVAPPSDDALGFWEATKDRRFVLPWCASCGTPFWHPRAACPSCLSPDIEWRDASGRGTVYAVSVMHQAALPQLADRVPYAVALIDLAEGPRMMSNVIGCPADDVRVGMAVELTWEALPDGRHFPQFQPAPAA